jgi:hypothetical protein
MKSTQVVASRGDTQISRVLARLAVNLRAVRPVVLVAVVVLVAGAAGFALGRATDGTTIHRTKKVIVREPASATDRLRKQFGIPTESESCDQFGIPEELCGPSR